MQYLKSIKKGLALAISLVMILLGTAGISFTSAAALKPAIYPCLKNAIQLPETFSKLHENSRRFTPVMAAQAPSEGVPIIYEYTKTATSDESISISGENFTDDVRFILYYQTTATNGRYLECEIQKLEPLEVRLSDLLKRLAKLGLKQQQKRDNTELHRVLQ